MNDRHYGLSQTLAEKRVSEGREQAAHTRQGRGARRPRRRRASTVPWVGADLVVRRSRGVARSSLPDAS
jgi:hypothetical protein